MAVSAADTTTAWASGRYGTIIKTTDGGATWINQESNTKANYLYDICATDPDTAWAVGGAGLNNAVIVKTSDGATWNRQVPPADRTLLAVSAVDASTAWATGVNGTIISTTDGTNWSLQDSGVNSDICDVSAADADNVWAVGLRDTGGSYYQVILKTDDGGATWSSRDVSPYLSGINAVDANTAWTVGPNGTILKTSDGGATWVSQASGTTETLLSVVSASSEVAWAFGRNGTILKTTDGTNWSRQSSGISEDIKGSSFAGGTTALAVGAYDGINTNSTFILKTTNGKDWYRQDSGLHEGWADVSACSPTVAWAAKGTSSIQSVYRTTDGGATWSPCSTPLGVSIYRISAVDDKVAWAVGGRSFLWMNYIEVYRTLNGGVTWETRRSIALNPNNNQFGAFAAVEAVDAQTAYAGGGYYVGQRTSPMYYIAVLIKTSNGGASWTELATGVATYDSISAVAADTAWVHGSGWENVLARKVGGATVNQNYPPGLELAAVSGVDASTAWAVGKGGAIIKTVNGLDWYQQSSGTTVDLTSVSAVDASTAYACGSTGNQPGRTVMLKTEDGGATWIEQNAWSYRLNAVSAADRWNVWAIGDNGAIVHSGDGGAPVLGVSKIVPASGIENTVVKVTDLAGACFEEGARVRLERGSTVVNATGVVVASGNRITCTLDLNGAPLGRYDVVVRNPGGEEARLAGGFSVTNICGGGAGVSVGLFGLVMGLLSLAGAGRLRGRMSLRRLIRR